MSNLDLNKWIKENNLEAGDEIDEQNFKLIEENNIENIEILNIDHVNVVLH